MDTQKVFAKGLRKAILTRIAPRRWAAAMGWAKDVKMTNVRECSTRRMAMAYVNDWLIGD